MAAARKFMFSTVPNIVCELGSSKTVGSLSKSLGCNSVILVTDPGIVKIGLEQKVS